MGTTLKELEKSIVVNLKDILDKRGISVYEMSVISGIKYDVVKRYYEDQITRIDKEIIKIFCKILECRPSDLIKLVPDESQ